MPVLDVTPAYYVRAAAAAAVIGAAGVAGLVAVSALVAPLGLVGFYLRWLALAGFGHVMGMGVSLATNRKRGRGLQWVAGIGVAATALAAAPLVGLSPDNFFGLLMVAVAVYLAVAQLRI